MNRFSKGKILTSSIILIAVLVFIWGRDAESAELGLGLGFGTFNTVGATIQELSIASDDYRWFASYTRIGGADSDRLTADYNDRLVLSYRTFWRRDSNLKPFLSFGAAYFKEAPNTLISERLTYDIRLGARWKDVVELEIDGHNSTAGRSISNSGFDTINLRFVFPF